MPDGRLVWPNRIIETDKPFVPSTREEVRDALLEGPYEGFQSRLTDHYVILHRGSQEFADASARLLESLYRGLVDECVRQGLVVHAAEFPLVAVIYRNESDFRAQNDVGPEVEAFYDIVTNRIFFYETTDQEAIDPKLAAMRRPQTVAHEGTHQVLQNIGVQPRMAQWPAWLVEGLAELASASRTRAGRWAGFGKINPYHMATMQDLQDGLATQTPFQKLPRDWLDGEPNRSLVEYIVTRDELQPTDYALAWSLTHYLNRRQPRRFLAYLRQMSRMTPFEPHSSAEHLASFRQAFHVAQMPRLDQEVHRHVERLSFDPSYVPVIYLAVTFEQELPSGLVRRGTLVSQSPSIVQEWLQSIVTPEGGLWVWQAGYFPTRGSARAYTRQWLLSR